MELYIIRHGKTLWNEEGKLQGRTDIPLCEEGRQAARELGRQLSSVSFDIIYASPLIRAYETASLIRGNRDIPIITDDRLMEISFGDMEGTMCEEWFDEACPYRCFFTRPDQYPAPPNGETLEAVRKRSRDFLQTVIENQADTKTRIMIVAHGALNKGLMCHIQQNDIRHYWGNGLQENCKADIFSFENKKWKTVSQ